MDLLESQQNGTPTSSSNEEFRHSGGFFLPCLTFPISDYSKSLSQALLLRYSICETPGVLPGACIGHAHQVSLIQKPQKPHLILVYLKYVFIFFVCVNVCGFFVWGFLFVLWVFLIFLFACF